MTNKLFMVVERFKDAPAVYRRFRDSGRMAPEGLLYISVGSTFIQARGSI